MKRSIGLVPCILAACLALAAGSSRTVRAEKGLKMNDEIRRPAVAGQFYEADPDLLRKEIEAMMAGEHKSVTGKILALVSPHAGYPYSGKIAACAYSLLHPGQFKTVVVISPSHVEYFPFSSVYGGKAYMTPLGEIEVDRELAEKIVSLSELVRFDDRGHVNRSGKRNEHALEVQLPFLQVALGDFKLVPIVMGDQSESTIMELGKALSKALKGENALIVASTDLSHFHDGSSARKLDGVFVDAIESLEPDILISDLQSGKTEACGGGPAAAAMIAARSLGADSCAVLCQGNSGDVTGDHSSVVGYVSAALISRGPATGDEPGKGHSADGNKESATSASGGEVASGHQVPDDARIFLLGYARKVIAARLTGKALDVKIPDYPVLKEKRGGFVTLKEHGELRGCIGYIEAVKPLVDTVAEMAEAAAFNDYRFQPVVASEFNDLSIEISVLSPIREVEDPSSIVVGRDGLIITRGRHRGLLLPQVATEWHWDRDTFLDQTCLKAGLHKGDWKKPDTKIEAFSAEVFSEKEMGLR